MVIKYTLTAPESAAFLPPAKQIAGSNTTSKTVIKRFMFFLLIVTFISRPMPETAYVLTLRTRKKEVRELREETRIFYKNMEYSRNLVSVRGQILAICVT
jgi:hypothetical protein